MKKRFLGILLAVVMMLGVCSFTACGGGDVYKVGVIQLVTHDALDAATQGFVDALKDELGEDNVEIEIQNAANSTDTCATIAGSFVTKNVDLIMANATPALQAAYNATTTIPILGTSVTEYGVALGIDNFSGTVGGNVSGTSDLANLDKQAQMIIDLFPDADTVYRMARKCRSQCRSKQRITENRAGQKFRFLPACRCLRRMRLHPFPLCHRK